MDTFYLKKITEVQIYATINTHIINTSGDYTWNTKSYRCYAAPNIKRTVLEENGKERNEGKAGRTEGREVWESRIELVEKKG